MISNRTVSVVLPAYNAERTLRQTVTEIPRDIVDDIILTDDANLQRSAVYGLGVLQTSLSFRMQRMGVAHSPLFAERGELRLHALDATPEATGA